MALSGERCDVKILNQSNDAHIFRALIWKQWFIFISSRLQERGGNKQEPHSVLQTLRGRQRKAPRTVTAPTEQDSLRHQTNRVEQETRPPPWQRNWKTFASEVETLSCRGRRWHASSFHSLEMTHIRYPICAHAGVYKWDSVLGKLRVSGRFGKWRMKVFLLLDWTGGGGTFHKTNTLWVFIVTNQLMVTYHCGWRCCQCLWLNKHQLRWRRSVALDLLLAGDSRCSCRCSRSLSFVFHFLT